MGLLVYKDLVSGDELVSGAYDLKEVDGIVYEVDCKMVTKGAVHADTGANASAEGGDDDDVEDVDEKVINLVDACRLVNTNFGDKKTYLADLKGYMKAVKQRLQEEGKSADEITAFEKGASKYVKEKLLPNFKDFEFYTGESMAVDGGMVALLNYREDGVTPYFIFWKHGLKEEKY